ncbi:MAG: TRAM domain-containing protein [Oscillospiraceae bacterium]|nr:TRAM domain-containing protein [Oscillospiraceae bacterium]
MTASHTHVVTITGYSSNGDGVARLEDGRVAFIRGAARGDVLEVTLIGELRGSVRAEIVKILSPSPYRIEPDCPKYPICGGCDFRHVTYEEELAAKLQRVNDALSRIGGLSFSVSEILSTGDVDHYRNKATFHSDGKSRGFYKANSREIVPVDNCLLLENDLNDSLKRLTMNGDVTLRSGEKRPDGTVVMSIDGLSFIVNGFFQVNTAAALLLFRKAREYASMSKDESLLDLYCGVGALTLFVGRDAGIAVGVEYDPAAVIAAKENAERNALSHVSFICADAAAWVADVAGPDCVIVDPPRKGLSRGALQKITALAPNRIVYASCDPATLARDLRLLAGYTLKEACVVDMFPRTANVECCCLLNRQ